MDRLIVPHHSPNDPRAIVVTWLVENGAPVTANQIVISLESAKSIFDVEAPSDGFLRHISAVGDEVVSGVVIGAVTATVEEELPADILKVPAADIPTQDDGLSDNLETERSATARAIIVARKLGIDISSVPGEGKITASMVEQFDATPTEADQIEQLPSVMSGNILLIGGGQGANLILDVISRDPSSNWVPVGILDDDARKVGTSIMDVPVLGVIDSAVERWKSGDFDAAVITISSNNQVRRKIFQRLSNEHVPFANIIDSNATIAPSASLGTGNVILGHCRVGPEARIGNDNFISAMVNIEHHCILGSHISFGPSVAFSGGVVVGEGVKFGTMIGCEPGVEIGEWSVIAWNNREQSCSVKIGLEIPFSATRTPPRCLRDPITARCPHRLLDCTKHPFRK